MLSRVQVAIVMAQLVFEYRLYVVLCGLTLRYFHSTDINSGPKEHMEISLKTIWDV